MRLKNPQYHWQEARDRVQNTLTRPKLQPFSQSLQKICRRFTEACQFQKAQPQILNLPQELLDEIIRYLPLLSRASLAICCTSFYIRLHPVLHHPHLQYPQHLFRNNQPYIKREAEKFDHTKLIRYLETSSWKYCPSCAKLHPNSTWRRPKKQHSYQLPFFSGQKSQAEIITRPGAGTPRIYHEWNPALKCWDPLPPSASQQPIKRNCLPWAGIVDICPCLSMTYHNRDQMRHLLQSMENKVHAGTEFFFENQFYHPSFGQENPCLYHECVRENTLATAEVKTVFYMQRGYLLVQSDYHVRVLGEKLPSDVEPLFSSSQKEKRRWFCRFIRFLNEGEVGGGSRSEGIGIGMVKGRKEGPRTKEFLVSLKRNLGRGEWPDRNWEQCRQLGKEKE